MADSQPLFDALSGAFGHSVNRSALNLQVDRAQQMNGLTSAQTQLAMQKAQESQNEQTAGGQLQGALGELFKNATDPDVKARAATLLVQSKAGNIQQVATSLLDNYKLHNQETLGDVSQLNQPSQTAAQQAIEGKVATPVQIHPEYATLPGMAPPNVQETPFGAAHVAQMKALTGKDVADAEFEHQKAIASSAPASGLNPAAADNAAYVVMADPSKMGTYGGFGKSGQANKDMINNTIAQKLTDAGMTATDMIRQRAISKASVGSAGQAAKQGATLDSFMPLIKANGNRILQLLDSVGEDGGNIPIIAGLERASGRQLGSDDLAEVHSVIGTYQQEVARLLASGPSMNGVISDAARSKLESMAPENMTSGQARRVIGRIDLELGLRRQGVQHALESSAEEQLPVTQRPARAAAAADTPAPDQAPAANAIPAAAAAGLQDGHITTFGNGQRWTLKNGQPAQVP